MDDEPMLCYKDVNCLEQMKPISQEELSKRKIKEEEQSRISVKMEEWVGMKNELRDKTKRISELERTQQHDKPQNTSLENGQYNLNEEQER